MRTLLAVIAGLLVAGCDSSSCPSPVQYEVVRMAPGPGVFENAHMNCSPDARMWTDFTNPDAPRWVNGRPDGIVHCEWRCVSYACKDQQDVRVDYDPASGEVVAVVNAESACD